MDLNLCIVMHGKLVHVIANLRRNLEVMVAARTRYIVSGETVQVTGAG